MLAAVALSVAALSGCGDEIVSDFVAVPSRASDPTPVSAFRSTLAEAALELLSVGTFIENDGTVDVTFTDGSSWTGFVDVETGEFDLLYELPEGFHLVSVHDAGHFTLDGFTIEAADYRETYTYIGTEARWDVAIDLEPVRMVLAADDLDRGTGVQSTTYFLEDRTVIAETWDLENGYHEDIDTAYYGSGAVVVEQEWTRDERSTDVSPDREGEFTFYEDGAGEGRLSWYYDHGIFGRYEIAQAADGSATATLEFEDPATEVSPDGQGDYAYDRDNSGGGTYTESYDDGSVLLVTETYAANGSYDEEFTSDDASTAITTDADGESHTRFDGSGDGTWRRYDDGGLVESCEYEFDTAGVTQSIDCE